MKQDRHKRLYDLHSWAGVLLGLFIYVVCFSGTIALFGDELGPWENPAQRLAVPDKPISINDQFENYVASVAEKGSLTFARLDFPHDVAPYYLAFAGYKDGDDQTTFVEEKWHPATAQTLPERGDGLSHWILDIHRKLMLPTTLGRTLVGIAGVVMMVLIITGILIHGKIIKDFFTLRLERSNRLKWQDSHKVLGIFGLPFYIVISFTGAFLGVVTILSPIIALIAFQGDTEALIAKVLGEPLQASGESVQMYSVDQIHALKFPETGETPVRVIVDNYGDKNAVYRVIYPSKTELNSFDQIILNGADGTPVETGFGITQITTVSRIVNALTPLHYATYGGIWLKWVYAALGLFMTILTATGLMLFVERRLHGSEGKKSDKFYERLSRVNIGVCMGFPLATAALFHLDKLYTGAEADRIYWTGVTYFTVAIGTTVFSLFQYNGYKNVKQLMHVLGGLVFLIPVTNALFTSARFWEAQSVGDILSNGVDLSAMVIGLLTLFAATQIPTRRNTERSKPAFEVMKTAPAE